MLLLAKLADAAPIEAGKAHPIPSQLHVPPFELFHKLDANSDSLIGLDQFTRVLRTTLKVSSEDVSDAELRELFDVVDVDGSGALPAFLVFLVLVLCVFCVVPTHLLSTWNLPARSTIYLLPALDYSHLLQSIPA